MTRQSTISVLCMLLVTSVALILTGCTPKGTRPDDMSHSEHKAAAKAEEAKAEGAETRVDPTDLKGGRAGAMAAYHATHATAHETAAKELATRHEDACTDVSDEGMRSCPLQGQVLQSVADLPDGVKIVLGKAPADPDALLNRARCHAAHGSFHGREGMAGCVFYVRDLSVDLVTDDDGMALVLRSDSSEGKKELKERADELASSL